MPSSARNTPSPSDPRVVRPYPTAFIAALCLGAAAQVGAQARPLAIERRGPPVVIAQAGGHVSVLFRVTNNTGTARKITGHLALPRSEEHTSELQSRQY